MKRFTHIDEDGGGSRMVDVTGKGATVREAVARGVLLMKPDTVRVIEEGEVLKGDVFGVAKIAGIMGAKRTSDLIPMCHPLELTGIEITFESDSAKGQITIDAAVKTVGRTGVEMEAMTAVTVAALAVYDMCKSADREIVIADVRLMKKSGGKSGTFMRDE